MNVTLVTAIGDFDSDGESETALTKPLAHVNEKEAIDMCKRNDWPRSCQNKRFAEHVRTQSSISACKEALAGRSWIHVPARTCWR